jgi:hypothetical protein
MEAVNLETINLFTENILKQIEKNNTEIIKKAIHQYKKDEEDIKRKTYLRNTKLLLKHYPEFEAHSNNAICSISDLRHRIDNETDYESLLKSNMSEDLFLESIIRSKTRTILLLNHIDTQLLQLKQLCIKKGNIHKYNMLIDYYVIGEIQERIAEKYQCHESQVSSWINEMVNVLTKLLFGIDSFIDVKI